MNKQNVYDFDFNKLKSILETGSKNELDSFMEEWGLEIVGDSVKPKKEHASLYKRAEAFWDRRQLVNKILLNSLYGGLLNEYNKFFDQRLGQSTTLSGRSITRHMTAKTAELIEGKYTIDDTVSIIYNDTDSVYFTAYPALKDEIERGEIPWTKESVIELYDAIANEVNQSFPEFLLKSFNVPLERSTGVIAAGREVVASSGLYVTKKRYAAMVYDSEGVRVDVNGKPGKLKITGMDLRRSDTPKVIQEFLYEVLQAVLLGKTEAEVIEMVRDFKSRYKKFSPWRKGSPKGVNGLTSYTKKKNDVAQTRLEGRKATAVTIPGHVQAAMNWNYLKKINGDLKTMPILDGQKVIVCPLKENNIHGMTSIAYPVDEPHLPEWFTSLPFNEDTMLEVVDQKLDNLLGVLKWDFSTTSPNSEVFNSLFG